ncbi:MAG: hypothetical protein FWG42_07370 [Clostridiales bacterium]|nr:hypothetical protein [Clostridiales bacterium]
MIEKICKSIEVFTLNETTDLVPAVEAVMNGKITLLKLGSVFSFVYNPRIAGLTDRFNILKERENWQTMNVVCTYEQAKQIVDRDRVNGDFFRITADFCSKAIVRIPVDAAIPLPFPYNTKEGTTQFLNFEGAHPILNAFRKELAERGCEYTSITSGNVHGAPTIEDLESAKMLAALFNIKASFLGMDDTQTVVTDIPAAKGDNKGSFIIISFCNPDAIEVKRLANKVDRDVTEQYLEKLFAELDTQSPLVYAL